MKYRVALFSGFTGSQKPEQWLCLAGLGGSKLPSFAISALDLYLLKMGMGFYTYFCKEIRSKTMSNKTLIKQLLRVKNIVIDSYKYCAEDDRFTISVHPTKGQQCLCPVCQKNAHTTIL